MIRRLRARLAGAPLCSLAVASQLLLSPALRAPVAHAQGLPPMPPTPDTAAPLDAAPAAPAAPAALAAPLALETAAANSAAPAAPIIPPTLGLLTGTIASQELEAPLAGAQVTATISPSPSPSPSSSSSSSPAPSAPSPPSSATFHTRTGDDGRFQLFLPPGHFSVRAELDGFRAVTREVVITRGAATTVDLPLPLTQALTEVIVVVGSRTPRTNSFTPVPVDVITAEDIARSGQSETARVLNALAPSFIAKSQTVADGTDHIDPASLRGLGPDQLLVLVNGKRRHQSALLNVNSTFGRGTVGVDLSAIPTAAIKRIEILRDGAASQYGSDAIAGVINIVLKESTDLVEIDALAGVTGEGDGARTSTSLNYGFRIGEKGLLNITGQLVDREATNRAGTYTGAVYSTDRATDDALLAANGLTREDFGMRIGEAAATVGMISYNLEVPLGAAAGNATFYSFGGLTQRIGEAAGYYRYPYQATQTVPELYPDGFLPEIHSDISDRSVGAGLRGERAGWQMDLSVVHGASSFQFNVENSVNASLGTSSPTSFDAGTLSFSQTVTNLDLLRKLDPWRLRSLSLVLGTEFRVENYAIGAGDPASWQLGDSLTDTMQPRVPGAQVFPGFRPDNEVDRTRNNVGAYVGLESQLTSRIMFDIGGRFERYSDFGRSLIGKAAARVELRKGLAVRGAVSTGFRAPSLHQLWFSTIATNFIINPATNAVEAAQVLTSNNASPLTRAFGVPDLEEERALSFSLGATFRPSDNLSITADGYLIDIDERIILAGRFTNADPRVAEVLAPFPGVSAAQFFANGIDTTTKGLDVVLDYTRQLGEATVTFTASANFTSTKVEEELHVPPSLLAKLDGDEAIAESFFFGRGEKNRIEDALPHQKGSAAIRYSRGLGSALLRASYYGAVRLKPDNAANDERFRGKTLFDFELGYQLTRKFRLTVGAENFLNTFPDEQTKEANLSAGRFEYSNLGQFGINGGFYYAKLRVSFF